MDFCYSEINDDVIIAKVERNTTIFFQLAKTYISQNEFCEEDVKAGETFKICIYPDVKQSLLDSIGVKNNEELFIIDFTLNSRGNRFYLCKNRDLFSSQFRLNKRVSL